MKKSALSNQWQPPKKRKKERKITKIKKTKKNKKMINKEKEKRKKERRKKERKKKISGASKDLKCVVFYAPVDMSNIHFLYSECTLSFLVL